MSSRKRCVFCPKKSAKHGFDVTVQSCLTRLRARRLGDWPAEWPIVRSSLSVQAMKQALHSR